VPYRKATIRAYRPEDESVLFTLARATFGDRTTWDDRRTLTALETDTVFVAELDGGPAGFVALEPGEATVRIEQLLVSPTHEGEGVGRQLLDYAEGFAIAQRARRLQVVVEEDNTRARAFYRGRGFGGAGGDVLELVLPAG
jgi:ribosomal protein S18 acetylase RimI-like enzyme